MFFWGWYFSHGSMRALLWYWQQVQKPRSCFISVNTANEADNQLSVASVLTLWLFMTHVWKYGEHHKCSACVPLLQPKKKINILWRTTCALWVCSAEACHSTQTTPAVFPSVRERCIVFLPAIWSTGIHICILDSHDVFLTYGQTACCILFWE